MLAFIQKTFCDLLSMLPCGINAGTLSAHLEARLVHYPQLITHRDTPLSNQQIYCHGRHVWHVTKGLPLVLPRFDRPKPHEPTIAREGECESSDTGRVETKSAFGSG